MSDGSESDDPPQLLSLPGSPHSGPTRLLSLPGSPRSSNGFSVSPCRGTQSDPVDKWREARIRQLKKKCRKLRAILKNMSISDEVRAMAISKLRNFSNQIDALLTGEDVIVPIQDITGY